MAEIDDLYSALEKADATGNAGDAREIAGMIRQMESSTRAPKSAEPAPAQSGPRNAQGEVIPDVSDSATAAITHAGDALTFGAMGPIAAYIAAGATSTATGFWICASYLPKSIPGCWRA